MTQEETIIKELKKYWYYAGDWHNAGCYFIINNEGVCNCNLSKNKKALMNNDYYNFKIKEKESM